MQLKRSLVVFITSNQGTKLAYSCSCEVCVRVFCVQHINRLLFWNTQCHLPVDPVTHK